ncbi:PepSY domain-containing protein [Pontibacillus litoralis]|uniref:PepSY domain-containing protein n=1 Tax=Pontibacillus litoralis JSM 072002 TaxID=1385512 RepID=A0A0A5G5S1_9BACI|nr:PepSY domain-containing protein [Pontibacillus litoralis]KGX87404.1 hypothetical protein N784_15825 [Pontibacillus litoralis JSM 072002]
MKWKIALVLFIITGLSYSMFVLVFQDDRQLMSPNDAKVFAAELYGGEVVDLTDDQHHYFITVENEKGVYHFKLDKESEKVSNVELVQKKDFASQLATYTEVKAAIEEEVNGKVKKMEQVKTDGKIIVEATVDIKGKQHVIAYDMDKQQVLSNKLFKDEANALVMTKKEAQQIAKEEVNGQIIDTSIVDNKNGQNYKVTIENELEVTSVYVQGNTGEVSYISMRSKQPIKEEEEDDDDEIDDEREDERIETNTQPYQADQSTSKQKSGSTKKEKNNAQTNQEQPINKPVPNEKPANTDTEEDDDDDDDDDENDAEEEDDDDADDDDDNDDDD